VHCALSGAPDRMQRSEDAWEHCVTENDRFYDGNEGQYSVAGKDEEKAEYCLLPADSVVQSFMTMVRDCWYASITGTLWPILVSLHTITSSGSTHSTCCRAPLPPPISSGACWRAPWQPQTSSGPGRGVRACVWWKEPVRHDC